MYLQEYVSGFAVQPFHISTTLFSLYGHLVFQIASGFFSEDEQLSSNCMLIPFTLEPCCMHTVSMGTWTFFLLLHFKINLKKKLFNVKMIKEPFGLMSSGCVSISEPSVIW